MVPPQTKRLSPDELPKGEFGAIDGIRLQGSGRSGPHLTAGFGHSETVWVAVRRERSLPGHVLLALPCQCGKTWKPPAGSEQLFGPAISPKKFALRTLSGIWPLRA